MADFESVSNLLFSSKKLDRDRGVINLQSYISNANSESIQNLETVLSEKLENGSGTWESKQGALLGCKTLFLANKQLLPDDDYKVFVEKIRKMCVNFLENEEVRIRLTAGEVLGSLCQAEGPQIYERCSDYVLKLIHANFCREYIETEDFNEDTGSYYLSSDPRRIFHDTAGWKYLETSMKCLQFMIDGCGGGFKPYIDEPLLNLLFQTLTHRNRFVRETGFCVLASLVACGVTPGEPRYRPFTAQNHGHKLAKQLGVGLGDNWSQVRLASAEAARSFILSFKTEEEREEFYPELLPKLCLNRYYIADGVRIYSQETWQKLVGDKGRDLVKKYIEHFVEYYCQQTNAGNHAVREAACACVAELASKIDREAMKPHVSLLLATLLSCFQDDSWPVRDAACLACGNFVLCYPVESKFVMHNLYALFFDNLKDCIPSVRQGAAGSLANVVKAYGVEAFIIIGERLTKGLQSVKDQPSESAKYGDMDKGPGNFGVVKKLRDNDVELHTDKTLFSCGSLAPKMGRSGCTAHTFRKISDPWELTDGCIHLAAELSQIDEVVPEIIKILPNIVEAVGHRHFTHYVCLLESLCKRLPNIAKGIGKQKFKQHLEMFLDPIFDSLASENILTQSAAAQCICQLSSFMGPNIFKSRVEMHNPSYLPHLTSALQQPEFQP